jgi:hypothetical protein
MRNKLLIAMTINPKSQYIISIGVIKAAKAEIESL